MGGQKLAAELGAKGIPLRESRFALPWVSIRQGYRFYKRTAFQFRRFVELNSVTLAR
jgi:hypothetical protein